VFWDEKIEGLSRDEMTHIQREKLRNQVKHAYEKIEFYRKGFDEKRVNPEEIKTVEDISFLSSSFRYHKSTCLFRNHRKTDAGISY